MFLGQLLDELTGLLAPHYCLSCGSEGSMLCDPCCLDLPGAPDTCFHCRINLETTKSGQICQTCSMQSVLNAVWVRTQYISTAQQLVHTTKFARAQSGTRPMARAIADCLPANCADWTVVPVPTTASRQRQRGFDQARLIAWKLARQTNNSYADILYRSGSARQVGSSRQDRLYQLKGVFGVQRNRLNLSTPVLIVDDVVTTGSTLEEAARTLRSHGFSQIFACAFAQA